MVEVLVDQVRVSLQEVGVQRLHDEADGVSIQLGAQELRKHFRGCGGQQVSAGRCVSAAASCIQSLAEFVGVGRLEVDANVLSSAAALCVSYGCCFLVTVNLMGNMNRMIKVEERGPRPESN